MLIIMLGSLNTLPKTNMAPKNRPFAPKGSRIVFQPSISRFELLVSGRVPYLVLTCSFLVSNICETIAIGSMGLVYGILPVYLPTFTIQINYSCR